MSATWRVRGGWALLAFCAVNWPLSIFTYAQGEPVVVLSLSWAAMILASLNIVATEVVSKQQEEAPT